MTKKIKNEKTKQVIPQMLSFIKKITESDGFMYAFKWGAEENPEFLEKTSIKITEKSVRGFRLDRRKEQHDFFYLQKVDNCVLEENKNALMLKFYVKFLGNLDSPILTTVEFEKNLQDKIRNNNYTLDAIKELAKRYVINIANGRFLWRNRIGAEKIRIIIKQESTNIEKYNEEENKEWIFDAYEIGTTDFDTQDESIKDISERVFCALSKNDTEKVSFISFEINAFCKLSFGCQVYPSEELILDKDKVGRGKKSRTLYSKDGVAAMHSQKIGNAIRTIDTWYRQKKNENDYIKPISIEQYGNCIYENTCYRDVGSKKDFYSLFDSWLEDEYSLSNEELKYVLAILIKGGVFSKKNIKKEKDKNDVQENDSEEQEE